MVLRLAEPASLIIGRLGIFKFPAGVYLYSGSAWGAGGLRARVAHHVRIAATPRWHFDHLRPRGMLDGGWYSLAPGALECLWSQAMTGLPGAFVPAPGFGSSDCCHGCPAHLVGIDAFDPIGMGKYLEETAHSLVIPFNF